jgi:hypothetical protein
METALAGLDRTDIEALLSGLGIIKENLRHAVQRRHAEKETDKATDLESNYG